MELLQNLSNNIKLLRKERRATLEGFSEELGISKTTLQEIESASGNPTLATIDIMAEHLQVPAVSLLSDEYSVNQKINMAKLMLALEMFKDLPAERRTEATELFLRMVDLFD